MPYNKNIWDNIFLYLTLEELIAIDEWGSEFHYPKILSLSMEEVEKMTDKELSYQYSNGNFRYSELTDIIIYKNVGLSNYSLQYLINLKSLMVLNNNRICDLSIQKLGKLEHIGIYYSNSFIGYSLPKLKKLKSLKLTSTPNLKIKYLYELSQLQELDIYFPYNNNVQLDSLHYFPKLETLRLWNQNKLKSKDYQISSLKKLTNITLVNSVSDPENFRWDYFPNLKSISIREELIKINQLQKLKKLDLIFIFSLSSQSNDFWDELCKIPNLSQIILHNYNGNKIAEDKYPKIKIKYI